MSEPKPGKDFSIFRLIPVFFHIALAAIIRTFTSPFRGSSGAPTYRQDVSYAVVRQILSRLTVAQSQGLSATTETVYQVEAKRIKWKPNTIDLGEGAKGHWMGPSNADYVMIFFHGGGYIGHATTGHLKYQFALQQAARNAGHRFAIFSISYTLAPHKVYPNQLSQAVRALKYLIEHEERDPSMIFLAGDSAGGNLASALLLHLARPHPQVEPLHLPTKIRGALLISPWISFDTSYRSYTTNAMSDYLTRPAVDQASSAFIGNGQHDTYSEPIQAPAEWWASVAEEAVDEVMIWGGGGEILIDPIRAFAGTMAEGFAIADASIQSARQSAAQRRSMAVAQHLSGVDEAAMKEAHWTGAIAPENAAEAELQAEHAEVEKIAEAAINIDSKIETEHEAEAVAHTNTDGVTSIVTETDAKDAQADVIIDAEANTDADAKLITDAETQARVDAIDAKLDEKLDEKPEALRESVETEDQHVTGDFIVDIDDAATRRRLGTERVFYLETPRASHEEQIMNHTLKIRKKAPSATVIEDWLRSRM